MHGFCCACMDALWGAKLVLCPARLCRYDGHLMREQRLLERQNSTVRFMSDVQRAHVTSLTPTYQQLFGNSFLTAPSFLLSSGIDRLSFMQRRHYFGLASGGGGRAGTPGIAGSAAGRNEMNSVSEPRGAGIVLEAHPRYPMCVVEDIFIGCA